MKTRLPLFAAALLCCLCAAPPARAEDIREKVSSVADAAKNEAVIDVDGAVYGVPFGASEDEIIQKFGKPAGYIRADEHRTALLYGKTYLLLCFDGSLDGLRISYSAVDGALDHWLTEASPFVTQGWRMSNGLKHNMSLKTVREIVKIEPSDSKYRARFYTQQCIVELQFSGMQGSERDEDYTLWSVFMARNHDGKNNWMEPRLFDRASGRNTKGRKIIGLIIANSDKGVKIMSVTKHSPADEAGIKTNDYLTGLNGESIVGMNDVDFNRRLNEKDTNQLEVTSPDGSKRTVQVERADPATFVP